MESTPLRKPSTREPGDHYRDRSDTLHKKILRPFKEFDEESKKNSSEKEGDRDQIDFRRPESRPLSRHRYYRQQLLACSGED